MHSEKAWSLNVHVGVCVRARGHCTPINHVHTELTACYKRRILQVLAAGFKSSRKFSKKLHLWDLLERVREGLLAEDGTSEITENTPLYHRPTDGGRCTPFHEADCKELFSMAVTRINGNNPNIGKDEKVSLKSPLLLFLLSPFFRKGVAIQTQTGGGGQPPDLGEVHVYLVLSVLWLQKLGSCVHALSCGWMGSRYNCSKGQSLQTRELLLLLDYTVLHCYTVASWCNVFFAFFR